MSLTDKWVCAGFFGPDHYDWRYNLNPAYVACDGWASLFAYFLIALSVASLIYLCLVCVLSIRGQRPAETFGISALIAVPSGLLWPITTFAAPVAALGFGSLHIGKSVRAASQRRINLRVLRDAETAKRTEELAPYIKQLEKELAR